MATSAPKTPVTLTVLDWSSPAQEPIYVARDKEFMRQFPTIAIKRQLVPYSEAPTRLRALIAAGSGPDILPGFPGAWVASYRNGFVDLNAYTTPQQRSTWPLLSSSVSPNGSLYLIADTGYAYAMGYNTALFAKAGLSAAPTTWAQLKSDCAALNASGVTPIAAGWKDGYYGEGFMYEFLGWMLTDQQKKDFAALQLGYTDPTVQKAIGKLKELGDAGCFGTGAEGRVYYDDVRNQFAAGKAAMVLEPAGQGPMEHSGLYPKSLGSKFNVFALPGPDGSARAQFMDYGPNGGWGIAKWSPNKEAAWLYISYLMAPKAQQDNWDAFQAFPVTKGVSIKTTFAPSQEILTWTQWPANGTVYTAFPQSVSAVFEKEIVDVMTGRRTVADLTSQMQAALSLEKARLSR